MDNITEHDARVIAKMVTESILESGVTFIKPRWVNVKDAASYSSLGIKKLKELAERGDIIGIKDNTTDKGIWRFDLESIDRFLLSQANVPNPERLKELLKSL